MCPKSSVPPGAFYYRAGGPTLKLMTPPSCAGTNALQGCTRGLGRSGNELANVGYTMGMEDSMRAIESSKYSFST